MRELVRRSVEIAVEGAAPALAVTLAFAASGVLVLAAGLPGSSIVFTVVVALQVVRRSSGGAARPTWAALLALPVLAVATALLGEAFRHRLALGDAFAVALLGGGFALRGASEPVARAGRLLGLPVVLLFVTPIAGSPGMAALPRMVLLSVLAGACALAASAQAVRPVDAVPPPPRRPSRLRPRPHTRIALQSGLALALALAIAQRVYPDRWAWAAVSVLAISGGLRSRGDVLVRGGERLLGALVGTAAATLLAAAVGDRRALAVPLILALVVAAVLVRGRTYAAYAFLVTAALALLYGLYGESGAALLDERLVENAIGAACVIVTGCLVYPIPTEAAVRRRVADALASLRGALEPGADAAASERTLARRRAELADASRPLRLAARLTRRPSDAARLAAETCALLESVASSTDPAGLRARERHLRRRLAGPPSAPPPAAASLTGP